MHKKHHGTLAHLLERLCNLPPCLQSHLQLEELALISKLGMALKERGWAGPTSMQPLNGHLPGGCFQHLQQKFLITVHQRKCAYEVCCMPRGYSSVEQVSIVY